MTVRVNKPSFNIREKLSELGRKFGLKGSELAAAETVQEARDLVSAGRKNLIINGAMEVAQRATSVTGSSGSAVLTLDRFQNHGSGGTYNSSQETVTNGGMPGLPIKFKKYFKFSVTTGANNCGIWQTIEDVRTVQGEHTFSFYAKGTNPSGGTLEVDARQYFNGSSDVDSLIGSFVLTDTWQRFTFTFTPPSLSGKTIGANNYYRIFIRQPDADNSTGAWHIDTTGWQLEAGRNATEFEHRSYGEELSLCQRYYGKIRLSNQEWIYNESSAGSHKWWMGYIPFSMRANPNIDSSDLTSGISVSGLSGTVSSISPQTPGDTPGRVSMRVTMSANSGTARAIYHTDGWAGDYLAFDAEL